MQIRLQLVSELGDKLVTQQVDTLTQALSALLNLAGIINNQFDSLECKLCLCKFSDVPLFEYDYGNLIDETATERLYEFTCEECLFRAQSEQIDEAASTGN